MILVKNFLDNGNKLIAGDTITDLTCGDRILTSETAAGLNVFYELHGYHQFPEVHIVRLSENTRYYLQ